MKELSRRKFLAIFGSAGLGLLACDAAGVVKSLTTDATPATATPNWEATVKAPTAVPTARVEATNAAPATATKAAVRPNVTPATAPAVAPAVRASLSTPESRAAAMKTADDVYKIIYQPCKAEIVGCDDLKPYEITPEKNNDGRIVGWRVLRERNGQNFIPPFFVRLPEELGMQFGFMNLKSDRETLGLTASEANMLGYQANHVGSGLPSGELLPVEGLTIYFDQSADLAKLVNQTGPQRRIKRQ